MGRERLRLQRMHSRTRCQQGPGDWELDWIHPERGINHKKVEEWTANCIKERARKRRAGTNHKSPRTKQAERGAKRRAQRAERAKRRRAIRPSTDGGEEFSAASARWAS